MPTVALDRDALFRALGREYTEEEFQNLCFDFGIELDEVTTEQQVAITEMGAERAGASGARADAVVYKIDIPANRYDLLCMEGLVRSLRVFLGLETAPSFATSLGPVEIHVHSSSTSQIRPYIVAAVLRNITFTPERYKSFIDLQDKLHQNICRRRTLVAIGTHDLDSVNAPFQYIAPTPDEIQFVPLKQTREMNGSQLMKFYESDRKLSKFLPIIRDSPVFPLVREMNGDQRVLSLPPIINSELSKISLETKNVLIECTATDLTKANVVLNTICAMFGEYTSPAPFTIEQVRIIYDKDDLVKGKSQITPQMGSRDAVADVQYIRDCTGLREMEAEEMANLLTRMSLTSKSDEFGKCLQVQVPVTRSDVMHEADIMEDVAIAYGFNRLPTRFPQTNTVGKQLEINKLADKLRREMAQCGWTEVLPLILCSMDETSTHLRDESQRNLAVQLSNPRTLEYQVVRTSLLPGLLKTISSNKSCPLPLHVFETGDIVLKDESMTRRARNERWIAGVVCPSKGSGFEIAHGVVDRVLKMLGKSHKRDYIVKESSAPYHFDGRSAEIVCDGVRIGTFGVLHPEVLHNFELPFLGSCFEICLEHFC